MVNSPAKPSGTSLQRPAGPRFNFCSIVGPFGLSVVSSLVFYIVFRNLLIFKFVKLLILLVMRVLSVSVLSSSVSSVVCGEQKRPAETAVAGTPASGFGGLRPRNGHGRSFPAPGPPGGLDQVHLTLLFQRPGR